MDKNHEVNSEQSYHKNIENNSIENSKEDLEECSKINTIQTSGIHSNKTITVYDIAKEAGVSPATVSRVLTNNARVSDDKRERILEIIEKYDFEPNWLARSLSKKVTNTIGMLVPDIRNPFYSNLFIECEIVAAQYGFNIILSNVLDNITNEENQLRNLSEKRVEAIIVVGGNVDEVHPNPMYTKLIQKISNKIPVIVAGELEGGEGELYRITARRNHGMEEIVEYLLSKGHKDIGIIGGRDSVIPTIRKRDSLVELLSLNGIKVRPQFIIDSRYTLEGGYKAAVQLLAHEKLPTAVIAINDICATGLIRALNEHGVRVPEDISIISYDDTFLAEIAKPSLTSVSYNLQEYARVIMETIHKLTKREEVEYQQYIDTRLVIRESCREL